jgi:hypothetical protein
MADPRLDVSIVDVGEVYATFLTDNSTIVYAATSSGGSASVGLAVTLSAANTVALVAAAGAVLGKLVEVFSDNTATVQVCGGMTLPAGTGATGTGELLWGGSIVGDVSTAAKGYIRGVNTGVPAELGVARGMVCDLGTLTAVEVFLD